MKNYTAKTLDEILKNAALEKNVEVSDLTYFVTEEKTGFLGFGSSISADVYAKQDVSQFINEYLKKFFDNLELSVEIIVKETENGYLVNLDAENNAVVIGRQGQSLRGLNQVLRNAINSEFKHRFYLNIDINNYREERYQKVAQLARRLAKNVQRDKISASLDPMPNDERKVVHQTLSNYHNIETVSVGEGKDRHIVINYVD